MSAHRFAVRIAKHPKTGCWVVRDIAGGWMHFAPRDTSEETAKSIVFANVRDCREVEVVDYNTPDA